DLTAFIRRQEQARNSLSIVEQYRKLELCLFGLLEEKEQDYNLKDWNEKALEAGCSEASPNRIKTLLNFWTIRNWIRKNGHGLSRHYVTISMELAKSAWQQKMEQRHLFARMTIEYLFQKLNELRSKSSEGEEVLVEFSVLELKNALQKQ